MSGTNRDGKMVKFASIIRGPSRAREELPVGILLSFKINSILIITFEL